MNEKSLSLAARVDGPVGGFIGSIEGEIPRSSIVKGSYLLHEGVAWKAVESSRHVGGAVGEAVFARRVCWFDEELRYFGPKLAISVDESTAVAVDFLTAAARRMDDDGIYGLLDEE